MAKNDEKKSIENLANLENKSSIVTYGVDSSLDKESEEIRNIIRTTIIDTKAKLGERVQGTPVNYFNELNFGNVFTELVKGEKKEKLQDDTTDLKRYMNATEQVNISGLQLEDATRTLKFNNFKIIKQHIPECAQALAIYKDNIMSPDDFTKLIFNTVYDKPINEVRKLVEERLEKLTEKYKIEKLADEIIDETLLLGESYLAALSLEDEMKIMLSDPTSSFAKGNLNEESCRLLDKDVINATILSENVEIKDDETVALNEMLGFKEDDSRCYKGEDAKKLVAQLINNNVILGSSNELLLERAEAEYDSKKGGIGDVDIPGAFTSTKKSKKSKNGDSKPLFLNGTALRRLVPERVVDLTIDNVCYGYYYAEEVNNNIPQSTYLGPNSGRDSKATMALASNNTLATTTGGAYSPSQEGPAAQLNVGEQKLRLISNLFLSQISKKIDKDFVRKNKKFKEFIYDLVRQDFIIHKGLKLTYFKPDEVIKFKVEPVYRDITFFAKLYLSILTNNTIIKLGRAHDKRVFYVNVGSDAQYAQAIQQVIQDIKTKDYKMENLNDFNTILNLTPGRFDDYFIPSVNGEKPVDIDTLPGMDVDMNNEFVEYLKNSMMSGMGVPRNLIDVTSDVDFARNISAMNANFVRSVIRYQKALTASFSYLYQVLYKNEYRYIDDKENDESIDIESIKVQFPSPATLAMTSISEQIQAADQNADFIATQIIGQKSDGSTEDQRLAMKALVVKDLLPGIDWDKYEEMKNELDLKQSKEQTKNKNKQATQPADPYGGMGY